MSGTFKSLGKSLGASMLGISHADDIDINRAYSTPYSSLAGGRLTLDPSIRAIQNEALGLYRNLLPNIRPDLTGRFDTSTLANIRSGVSGIRPGVAGVRSGVSGLHSGYSGISSGLNTIQSGIGGLRESLTGNRGAFMNARLNPLRQALAQRRGELTRSNDRRGVYGTFANQDLTNLDIAGNRAIADEAALALNEAIAAESGLYGQEAGLQGMQADLLDRRAGLYGQEAGLYGQEADLYGREADIATRELAANEALTGAEQNQFAQYAGIADAINRIGSDRFSQELSSLGLSSDTINALLELQLGVDRLRDQTAMGAEENRRKGAETAGRIMGSFLGGG